MAFTIAAILEHVHWSEATNVRKKSDRDVRTVKEQDIAGFLNRLLNVRSIDDASRNGLQVRTGNKKIVNVGFAVDACLSTFRRAQKKNVDLLVVHHGIKWTPRKDPVSLLRREAFLKQHGIALYAVHLPLDLHRLYGNNSELCRMVGLNHIRVFGNYHGRKIGFKGDFNRSTSPREVARLLDRELNTHCRVFPFGPARMKTLGVVSGGGGSMLPQAVREGLDGFLVGEIDLAVYNSARESSVNLIVAGHYATETTGVKALMPLVADTFKVKTMFIDDRKEL